jgi:serine/threonine-protein kinase
MICDVPPGLGWGASWGEDGTIFFATSTGISKVSAAGGMPATVTTSDGALHLLPQSLPGGNVLLFTLVTSEDQGARRWEKANVVLRSLDTGDERVLIPGGADARYVSTGHLVYMKSATLMAVPFDVREQQVRGAPVALIEGVMQSVNTPNTDDETGAGQFAISTTGTLLYVGGGISPILEQSLVWVDRTGSAKPLTATSAAPYSNPRLSPDGQKIAVVTRRAAGQNSDVWVYDVSRGAPTRLTFEGGMMPTWSPDGRRLVYTRGDLYTISADGTGKPQNLTAGGDASFPTSWASAANMIVFLRKTKNGSNGIWVLPMEGAAKPTLFLESRFELWHPDLSPDGRWMAYVSFESGTNEVYVQSYPGPGEKVRISPAGGFDPLWTRAGRELVYRSGTPAGGQQFLSAAIRSLSPFQADTPRLLFEAKFGEYDSTAPERSWDVSADGQRFLLLRSVESTDKPVTVMHVVLNWTEELKRLVPAK